MENIMFRESSDSRKQDLLGLRAFIDHVPALHGNVVHRCEINTGINDLKYAELAEAYRSADVALDTLARQRALLDGLFARVPEAIVLLDTDDRILQVNPEFTRVFGYAQEEACGRLINELVVPEELLAEAEEYTRRGLRGESLNIETVRKHKDGTRVYVSIVSGPVSIAGSQICEYVIYRDITERKRAEQSLRESEAHLAEAQRLSRTGSFSWRVATEEITWSEQLYRIFEFDERLPVTLERIGSRVHPDDLPLLQDMLERARNAASDFEYHHRLLMPDQSVKHIHFFAHATRDKYGRLEYIGAAQDVTDLLTITDAIPIGISVLAPDGTTLYVNQRALDWIGVTLEEVKGKGHLERTCHPDDRDRILEERRLGLSKGVPFELEMRLLPIASDKRIQHEDYRWHLSQYNPLKGKSGEIIRWYVTALDIDDRKRAEQALQRSQFYLSEGQRLGHMGSWAFNSAGFDYWSPELFRVHGLDPRGKPPTVEEYLHLVHPKDREFMQQGIQKMLADHLGFDFTKRIVRPDGKIRHVRSVGVPVADGATFQGFVGTEIDITEHVQLTQKLQQNEEDLRTIIDTVRQIIVVFAPDGTTLYANRVALDSIGITLEEARERGFFHRVHREDVERVREERRTRLLHGIPFDVEMRVLLKNGQYCWLLVQYDPLKDERGQTIRWYVTATDIDEKKKTEERLRNENLVLREEIDRSSMFEEIVGSSKPIRQVLKHVEKVAPSDSTVLILGETGTGKELIARALHRRSKRANRPFIRVNCAAIPQSLIAPELFGHEKGAFTGALQRRVGRFEAANGGTLFLDEIGELPMETQIALLRVLQEKEFERVGSNHPISVDVRLITATNRDLSAAVAAGTFRHDLFFRLNVFPIAVPPLRDRAEDIPLLVEYFVGRFAKEAGKNIRHIGRQALEQLQAYHWPGNIRELQNIVERAVILSETDTFVVDASWLKTELAESSSERGLSALEDREVEMITATLSETHGRISGPSGAATKLGIPRQTLESKLRRLGIDKYGQKRPTA
jgi:PAS domain S-box-containing protein